MHHITHMIHWYVIQMIRSDTIHACQSRVWHRHVSHCEQWYASWDIYVSFAEYRLFYRALLQNMNESHCEQWYASWDIYVSFAEYRLFYRALLQKRPMILRRQSRVWQRCMCHDSFMIQCCHMCDVIYSYMIHMIHLRMIHSWQSRVWHRHVWHDSFICVTWLIHHSMLSYVWCDSFIYEWLMWFIHIWMMNDSFICVTWLIHMCDMTHSYVWHDSFIWVTWLIHMCDMTHSSFNVVIRVMWFIHIWMIDVIHSYMNDDDSFICVTCLIHVCDMTHSYVWHDSFIIQSCACVVSKDIRMKQAVSHIWMRYVTHMNEACHT